MGKDPAFLFYDGDAARDVSHMNRLERGCYFDFIQAQKKFGPLSLNVIKKILGNDFQTCWESLKICLTYDNDMYYITWLKESIEKRQKYSESRSKNKKGTKVLKTNNIESTYVHHMEIANEDVNEIENTIKNAFDEIYMEQQKMKWPHLNFDFEYRTFCEKVRGSPSEYRNRDSGSIRLAFQYQLRQSKNKNGNSKGKQSTADLAEAFAIRVMQNSPGEQFSGNK